MVLFDPRPDNYLYVATPDELELSDIRNLLGRMPVTWDELDDVITFSREVVPFTLRMLTDEQRLSLQDILLNAQFGPAPRTVLVAEWPEYLPNFGDNLTMTILLDLCFHMCSDPGTRSFIYTPGGMTVIPAEPGDWTVSLRSVEFPRYTVRGAFPGTDREFTILSQRARQDEMVKSMPAPTSAPAVPPPSVAAPTPKPGALTALPAANVALVIRTDFTDDARWEWLQAELSKPAYLDGTTEELFYSFQFVDDRQFEGVTMEQVVDDHGHGADEMGFDGPTYLYLADGMTMTHPEHPLLAVNLYLDAGESFRLVPAAMPIVDVNLSIANLSFSDYMDSAGDGIHRGF